MKKEHIPGYICMILAPLILLAAAIVLSPSTSKNEANIHPIGSINGNGSIIAVIEFEGRRYIASTAGGIVEIK